MGLHASLSPHAPLSQISWTIWFYAFQCASVSELLFSLVLLHQVRLCRRYAFLAPDSFAQLRFVEKMVGSERYLNTVLVHVGLSTSLLFVTLVHPAYLHFLGPHAWILSLVVLFVRLRPPSCVAIAGGVRVSDTSLTALLSLQLILAGSQCSWILSCCGLFSALLQHRDPIGVFAHPLPRLFASLLVQHAPKPAAAQISPFIASIAHGGVVRGHRD